MSATEEPHPSLSDRLQTALFVALMWVVQRLPYERRVPLAGRLTARAAAWTGFDRRIKANLALACPELSADEVKRLCRAVPDNIGRSLAEIYSGPEFLDRVRNLPLTGPGAARLAELKAAGKPTILAASHFGNYDAWRGAMAAQGYPVGALYRPMNNRTFNTQYVSAISGIAQPLFARDKRGMAQMLRFLREGGFLALGIDQYFHAGADLTFFGQLARTPLSAAEIALKYDVPLIPIFAVRQPDGLNFRIEVEEAITPGTPEAMTQAFNDVLETKVRAHMDQWFWIHRRWKYL